MTAIGHSTQNTHSPLYRIPYMYRVTTGRGNMCPIGRPCHNIYQVEMAPVSEKVLPCLCIPYPHLIIACRGNVLSIRGPRKSCDNSINAIGGDPLSSSSVPHSHAIPPATRGNVFAIRGPR